MSSLLMVQFALAESGYLAFFCHGEPMVGEPMARIKGRPTMGSLITETPHSEVTATLEWLDMLGITRDDLKTLRKAPDQLKAELVSLLNGNVIDCDAPPPDEWGWDVHGVIKHIPREKFVFVPSAVELYRSPKQAHGVKGIELYEELDETRLLNINVLQYLLQKPFLVPEEWRDGRRIYFFGTTWRARFFGDGTHAAYMEMVGRGDSRDRRRWDTKVKWLEGNDFHQGDYIALSKA